MKRNLYKLFVCSVFMIVMLSVCAIGVYAYTSTDHQDPIGGTAYYYAFDSSECNRTINVTFQDTSGNFLKKVVIYTKHGEDSSFHIGMGGYDITKFESNQSLWETCKIVWTSGTGLCTEADLWVDYYFRTGMSKKELNITVTMRKWDTIEFEVRHYVEQNPNLNFFHRDNYVLHSITDKKILNYYDAFSVSNQTITGYTLHTDYQASVSGNLCFRQLVGSCRNFPTSPRCYEYDFHNTSWSEDMGHYSSYNESKDGKLDWCNNRKFWVEYLYDINEYTITYDANGGTGAPGSQTKYHGYDISIPDTVPTRSGYTFMGWGTSSTSTTVSYQAGGTYTANTGRTLYAVWKSNTPAEYTVSYNANGGMNAPAMQTKKEDTPLTLSTQRPTRNGYDFLGWNTSSTATSATYHPGDSYTANASVTLYAVWEKTNYDFSVSGLNVSNSEPYKYDQIAVSVRCDSWDKVNAYTNIPVQLYYDGRLISTQYINFSVYGLANITFTLNVGRSVGNKTVEARINWADHNSETRTGNNTVSTSINVQDYDYEVSIDPVVFSDSYCEGTDVISSFYVHNDSDYDIIPEYHNTARFVAYYYNGTDRIVISTQDWADVVIPAGGTNLVYFKWRVPTGLNGKTVCLECTVNADRQMNEDNYDNNTALLTTTVSHITESQTPDTRFEGQAPGTYQNTDVPYATSGRATWTIWGYENGGFVLKKYGIQVSPESPEVVPGTSCATAVYENGTWRMRSGYGVMIRYMPGVTTVSDCLRPEGNAYTMPQLVVATFPEYRYNDAYGNCRTLEYIDGMYQFVENADADGNERLHFIPVYVQDGDYVVSVMVTQIWTPAGMITAVRNSAAIIIDGTVYDDWYQ